MKRNTITIDSYEILDSLFGKGNYNRNHQNDSRHKSDYSESFTDYLYSDATNRKMSAWGNSFFDSAKEQYISDHYNTFKNNIQF